MAEQQQQKPWKRISRTLECVKFCIILDMCFNTHQKLTKERMTRLSVNSSHFACLISREISNVYEVYHVRVYASVVCCGVMITDNIYTLRIYDN